MPDPVVSIIVPSFNHYRFITSRIESILSQTFADFELIVIDDASTDGSLEMIREFESDNRVQIISNDINSGSPFKQWTTGIEKARGRFIWIAESDDIASSEFLETTLGQFKYDEQIGIAYCDSIIIDENGCIIDYWKNRRNSKFKTNRWDSNYINSGNYEINNFLSKGTTINNVSSALFRKSVFEKFDFRNINRFRYLGDWFVYLNICSDHKISYVEQPLNFYREHNNNFTKSAYKFSGWLEEFQIINNWFVSSKIVTEEGLSNFQDYSNYIYKKLVVKGNLTTKQRLSVTMKILATRTKHYGK